MNASSLRLKVENFRAISQADIKLDEITVLTGVNACGKSTLAHLLHSLINLNAVYPVSLIKFSWGKLSALVYSVCDFRWQMDHPGEVRSVLGRYGDNSFEKDIFKKPFTDLLEEFDRFQQKVLDDCAANSNSSDVRRIYAAFVREIGFAVGAADSQLPSTVEVSAWISNTIHECINAYNKALTRRDYDAFVSGYGKSGKFLLDKGSIALLEGDSVVYSTAYDSARGVTRIQSPLAPIYGVTRALYIESPWHSMPAQFSEKGLTFNDGFPDVPIVPNGKENLFEVLSGEMLSDKKPEDPRYGILASQNSYEWFYERKDGLKIGLRDCATGIRSLAILNVLYTRGILNSKTLLIIDEPEAHLHPQWIVAYAGIIVSLVKKLKVRVLITTHSPYMIRALRGAANRELEESKISFYLAEPADDYRFTYRDIGTNIAPIFKVFTP